jgi:hypothetical protein
MSIPEIKAIYDSLLESGELQTFHPDLVGDWDLDKKIFKSLYNATENILGGIDDEEYFSGGFDFYEDY